MGMIRGTLVEYLAALPRCEHRDRSALFFWAHECQ